MRAPGPEPKLALGPLMRLKRNASAGACAVRGDGVLMSAYSALRSSDARSRVFTIRIVDGGGRASRPCPLRSSRQKDSQVATTP